MRITSQQRAELKKPLGKLVKDPSSIPKNKVIIVVGDIAGENLIKSGFKPKICIYDEKTERKDVNCPEVKKYGVKEVGVKNPAGHLTPEVFAVIRYLLSSEGSSRIFVEGEEDLTALAAIREAPDGALVVYGQPGEGMVVVEVNKETRANVIKIIEGMENGD